LYPLQRHHHHHHHHHDDGAASGAWAVIIMKHTTTLDCSTLGPKKGGCATPKQSAEHTKRGFFTHSLSLWLFLSCSLSLSLSLLQGHTKKEQHKLSLFCLGKEEIQKGGLVFPKTKKRGRFGGPPSCGISFIVG